MAGPFTADRVKQTSTTTGTGTLSLVAPASGARSFVSGIGNGNSCYYCISHQSADEWEVGIGTVTSGSPDTLSRTTILSSSNSGSAVTFSAGTKDVFVVHAAKYGAPFLMLPTTYAIKREIEDNPASATPGNARGTGSNDLQPYRDNAAQVASGNYSGIFGGTRNKATGNNTFIGGGNANLTSATNSAIAGGASNKTTGTYSFIGAGKSNYAQSTYGTIPGGYANTINSSSAYATISGGRSNTIHGTDATIIGGSSNYTTNNVTTVLGGRLNSCVMNYGTASGFNSRGDKYGQQVQAAGKFAAQGDAQASALVGRVNTTNATQTELLLDGLGGNKRLTLNNDCSWGFEILIVARRTDADNESAVFQIVGGIDRNTNAASTALIAAITKTVVARDDAAWDVDANADTTNGSLRIEVTGEAAKNIQWVAFIRIVETTG